MGFLWVLRVLYGFYMGFIWVFYGFNGFYLWMAPAASGAVAPAGIVQHLTSVSPAVKKYARFNTL
jgi:hypothetical protein